MPSINGTTTPGGYLGENNSSSSTSTKPAENQALVTSLATSTTSATSSASTTNYKDGSKKYLYQYGRSLGVSDSESTPPERLQVDAPSFIYGQYQDDGIQVDTEALKNDALAREALAKELDGSQMDTLSKSKFGLGAKEILGNSTKALTKRFARKHRTQSNMESATRSGSSMSLSLGSTNNRRFTNRINISFPWTGLPRASTNKRLKEFCVALKDVGADACKEVKDAIDGRIALAKADQLKARIGQVTIQGRSEEETTQEDVLGIILLEHQLKESYAANYPRIGNAELRTRAEIVIRSLVGLSSDNPEYQLVKPGFELTGNEIGFWRGAETDLLERGMSKDKIIDTRSKYLDHMTVLAEKMSHMNNIAQQYAAAGRYVELADNPDIENADQLIDDYKNLKSPPGFPRPPGFPTDDEITGLRAFIDHEVEAEGVANFTVNSPGYNASTERVMQRYKEWRESWKQGELLKAREKLVGWPQHLISELAHLKLSEVGANTKTKFIDASYEKNGFARAWTLDAALMAANRFTSKNVLNERDAQLLRDWLSKYLGKAIAILEKDKGKGSRSR
jgi:hypothetical protein